MTFIKRLMEIKEWQCKTEKVQTRYLQDIRDINLQILKVLEGRKDGKRKISRKD